MDTLKIKHKDLLREILLIYVGINDIIFIEAVSNEVTYFAIELFKNG